MNLYFSKAYFKPKSYPATFGHGYSSAVMFLASRPAAGILVPNHRPALQTRTREGPTLQTRTTEGYAINSQGVLKISDLNGTVLKTIKLEAQDNSLPLSVVDLAPGMYLIELQTLDSTQIKKLSILR